MPTAGAASPRSRLAALLGGFPASYDKPAAGTLLPPARSAAEIAALIGALGRVPAARPLCLRAAGATEPELRAAAMRALGAQAEGAEPAVHEALGRGLNDAAPSVRRAAAAAIARRGADALPLLVPLLRDPDFELRAVAAWALGTVRATAAADALLGALRDDPQLAVVEALGRQGDRRAVGPLGERLREDTPAGHEAERAAVIEALGALAAPESAAALAAELWHPDPEVRLAAARALGAVPAAGRGTAGREALAAHVADPNGAVRQACHAALATPGGRPASATAPAAARGLEPPPTTAPGPGR
jgi:HEAT repeat protein